MSNKLNMYVSYLKEKKEPERLDMTHTKNLAQ